MKKLLTLLAVSLAAGACINKIPVDFGDVEARLVLNAQLLSQGDEQLIYLSESYLSDTKPVTDAAVTVEVDGKGPITAEALPLTEQDRYAAGYRFQGAIPAGSRVKVTARTGDREVWASSEVTEAVAISSVDTARVMVQSFDEPQEAFQFRVTFQDIPGDTYYQIGVRAEFVVHQVDAEGRTLDIPTQYELPVDGSADPVLGGNSTMASIFELTPTYLVFTDVLFRDKACTIRLSIPPESLYPYYYYWDEDFVPRYALVSARFFPWLETITREEYHYLCALNNLENFGYEGQVIVEPTTLPTNVNGGLGFVTVRNRSEAAPIDGGEWRQEYYYDDDYYAE